MTESPALPPQLARNYDRLAQVNGRYDQGNTFHINQNIQPAGGPGAEHGSSAGRTRARYPQRSHPRRERRC